MNNILVISPHPDDEAIGCGGAICKHVENGDVVHVIFLTSGEKGGHDIPEEKVIGIREKEAEAATEILQVAHIEFWREPDGKFEAGENNVNRLIKKLKSFSPNIIYVPHEEEENSDHKAAARLVKQSVAMHYEIKKPVVLMYEVWTPLQKMDTIIDFTSYVYKKKEAIQVYSSQCTVLKFDEAILGLNRYRGEMHSWPGGDYAEVFKEMKF